MTVASVTGVSLDCLCSDTSLITEGNAALGDWPNHPDEPLDGDEPLEGRQRRDVPGEYLVAPGEDT